MIPVRPVRRLPPRYTLDGVSVNDTQIEEMRARRRSQAAERSTQPAQSAQSGQPRARGGNGNTRRRRPELIQADDMSISSNGNRPDGDDSDNEDRSIRELLQRVRKIRLDADQSPATDEIKKDKHSTDDLSIIAAIRAFIATHAAIERKRGPRNSVIYGPLRDPPSNPDRDEPTLAWLTFAWNKPPSHAYNRTASLLVAEHLIRDEEYTELFDHDDPGLLLGVAQQVRVHVRHLSQIWKKQQYERSSATEDQRQEAEIHNVIALQAHAANHRRRLTLDRRGATAAYYSRPAWIAILNHVGATSMSSDDLDSDEDSYEPGSLVPRVYYIIRKSWRSLEFIEFLRLLDRLADVVEKRTKFSGRSSRVRRPVPEGRPIRETARAPCPKLNREFYSLGQQNLYGPYHRYHHRNVDLAVALADIRDVARNEGVLV